MESDDILLARKVMEGDYGAFREVYDKYSPVLYSMALKFLKDESMAANTVQTVFVKLWENRRQIVVNINLKSYLYSAAKHQVLNTIRNRNVELRGNWRYARLLGDIQDDAQACMERDERSRQLSDAIARLPVQQARVVSLKREGLGNEEIARKLNISVSTVKFHYNEALKALRKIVGAVALIWLIW